MARKKKSANDELNGIAHELGVSIDEVKQCADVFDRFEAEWAGKEFKPAIREEIYQLLMTCTACVSIHFYLVRLYWSITKDRADFPRFDEVYKPFLRRMFDHPNLNGLKWRDVDCSLREYWRRWATGEDLPNLRADVSALAEKIVPIVQHYDQIEREEGFSLKKAGGDYRKTRKSSAEVRKARSEKKKAACFADFDEIMEEPGMWRAEAIRRVVEKRTPKDGKKPSKEIPPELHPVSESSLDHWLRDRAKGTIS